MATPEANFDASSPDEMALVAGAKHLGVEFVRRPDLNTIEVAVINKNTEKLILDSSEISWIRESRIQSNNPDLILHLTFPILEVLDFDNYRKRMSIIIRDHDGSIKLICKGADSSMVQAAG